MIAAILLALPLQAAPPSSPPQEDAINRVLVILNDRVLTQHEYLRHIRNALSMLPHDSPPEEFAQQQRAAAEGLVGGMLWEEMLARHGVTIPERAIDQELDRRINNFGTRAEYLEDLERRGLTLELEREAARRDLAAQYMIQIETGRQAIQGGPAVSLSVSPMEIDAFYRDNPQEFVRQPRKVARALFRSQPVGELSARDYLIGLRDRLHAGTGDFQAEAASHSEWTADSLAIFRRFAGGQAAQVLPSDDLPLALRAELERLAPGGLAIRELRPGWALIELLDELEGGVTPLAEAQLRIERDLKQQKQAEILQKAANRTLADSYSWVSPSVAGDLSFAQIAAQLIMGQFGLLPPR